MLSAVIGISGFLIKKSSDKGVCDVAPFCQNCTKYTNCKLPEKQLKKQDNKQ